MYPYFFPYLACRCRLFPWLPRQWWSTFYWPSAPFLTISKQQEIAILEYQAKLLEQTLDQIKKRLDAIKGKKEK